MYLQTAQKVQAGVGWDAAREHYQSAIAQGTEQIKLEAYLLLGELLRSWGNEAGFRQAMEAAYGLTPDLSIEFDNCSSMNMLGGYIDERDIELDVPIHVVLVWEIEQDVDLPEETLVDEDNASWQFFLWRDRVFQIGVVENLVPDGGFERMALPGTVVLPQLPNRLYGAQELIHTALAYESPLQNHNMILTLYGRGQTWVGLGSPHVDGPTGQGEVGYLVTGRYQSTEGAVPRIGVRWWLRDAASWDDNVSTYAVEQPSTDWVRFARLAIPPENTDRVQAWIINADDFSHLYVDNLGLFRVPLPCSVD